MRNALFAVGVGIAVGAVAFICFGLYMWTAIHSGWSDSGLRIFYLAALLVPPALGLVAGWITYRTQAR